MTGALTRAAGETVSGGPYAISQGTLAANTNYVISYTGADLTITPATLTVTANAQSKVYGAADPALTYSASGFQFSDTAATVLTGALTRSAGETVSGGPYAIKQGTLESNSNYVISYTGANLTITPATLTVTANAQTKVYGAADPTLAYSASGFQFSDTAATVLSGALARAAGETVSGGPYAISQGTLASNTNYVISYTGANLTITPATLTVTANARTKVYRAADPTLAYTASGFQFSDTAATVLTGALTRAAGETVSGGPYAINQGTLASSSNYVISYTGANLAITPATVTVTANAQTKVYGAADPTLTYSNSGFQFSDTAATVLTGVLTRAAGETVSGGPYAIKQGTLESNSNYVISYTGANLTITPATLTVTANAQTKIYGAALPTLTASYSGFVNGDTAASLTTAPTLATTATAASHVSGSPYAISASGAVDPNYTITYVAGALTVTPAPLTITADDKTKLYGAALPTLTASYSGFVNGDSAASLTTAPTLSTTATAASHVSGSPYAITAGGAVDGDYTISYVAGSLTVTPAALTITADDKSKVYGAALPIITASYSGFVNGDSAASLTTAPTLSTTATAASHVSGSPYAITASGAVDGDYTITYVAGELTVTPAPLTITADDKSKVYGAALPTLTASYSGFVNGDTPASLTTAPTLSTTATAGSHVSGSPYAIAASGAADADYTISYVPGALTVTPATLTVHANDASKAEGAANPTFTDTISGFVSGDSASVVSGAASLSTTATTTSLVGSYPITAAVGTLAAADYTFAFQNGTLTVTVPFSAGDAVYTIGSGTVSVSAADGLLKGDTGPSQLAVTAGTVTGAQRGSFVFHADGSFTYAPSTSFPGYDSASFTVTDASGDKATHTVTVLSQRAAVVWKFYESVLNRTPDAAGLQYWTNYFNTGGNTGDMAFGFFESDELLDKVLGNYYEQYLLRPLDSAGLTYWKGVWHATGGPEEIKAGFADSAEFYNSAGATPQSWLTALYQRILNRTPDPNGESFWMNYYQQQTAAGVDAGTIRYDIALGFFDSAEGFGNDNLPEYATNPPTPADGTAAPLADYYQTAAQSQASIAAKDALFAGL
ncbi:MAG: hypothetical protein B7Z74_00780 [Deltaproteobacteria bacterium 21-66-5]|nr:MAG: hypothetical protein B7Z74_00780 [Deltaproteobacteria bacterium 21-66-5]